MTINSLFSHRVMSNGSWHVFLIIACFAAGSYLERAEADSRTYSLWGTPGEIALNDTQPVEVGMKFSTSVDGEISAVRFYRGVPNHAGYLARIWSESGELLGVGAAYEGQQPAPGWQTVQVYPPVPIVAGQTYIASYYSSTGQYSFSQGFFANGSIVTGPLTALGDDVSRGNGLYLYGFGGGFPTESYQSTNYWVDVVFKPKATDPVPTGDPPAADGSAY